MKWTEIQTGRTHSAFQHFMVALGEKAEIAVDRINADPEVFAGRLATYALNGGVEPTPIQQKARKIMGKNFFGVEEAIKYFGINPSRRQLAMLSEIPFPESVLEQCKDSHVLVAVFPISILEIRGKVERKLFYGHEDSWYNNQDFAKERGELGWQLICKTPVENSFSKNWEEQLALLPKEDEVPTAQQVTYTVIGHYLNTGERLFERTYVRTSSLDSYGSRVDLGHFDSDGLLVSSYSDHEHYSDLGLVSSRKS